MDHDQTRDSGLEIDTDNVINKLVSLLEVVAPSSNSILDASKMINAPSAIYSTPANPQIKLDKEVCEMLSEDIEKLKDSSESMKLILKQLADFADGGGSSSNSGAAPANGNYTRQFVGEAADVAKVHGFLEADVVLELFANMCNTNSVAVESLSTLLVNKQLFWTLFPKAVYCTMDVCIHMSIVWKLIGAYVDLKSLAQDGTACVSGVVDHQHPRVLHANHDIKRLLDIRSKIVDISAKTGTPVSVTEILEQFIVPVVKTVNKAL